MRSFEKIPELTIDIINRFWSKVNKGNNGCWEWLAGTFDEGYGAFWIKYKNFFAHRVCYKICYTDPGDKFVCHKCDNPKCVNPEHLFLGTHQDNMTDCKNKGRTLTNSKHCRNSAKLNKESVKEIRMYKQQGVAAKELAKIYAVSQWTIFDICNYRSWKDI